MIKILQLMLCMLLIFWPLLVLPANCRWSNRRPVTHSLGFYKFWCLIIHPRGTEVIFWDYTSAICIAILYYAFFAWLLRCRRGSADLLINFDDHWHTNISLNSQESSTLLTSVAGDNICGKGVPRGYWVRLLC